LQARFQHLHKLLELSKLLEPAKSYIKNWQDLSPLFKYPDIYQTNMLAICRRLSKKHQESGNLELITCAATHGFLPLLSISETAVRNQIAIGVEAFKANFGYAPSGFWLPECGFYPGLEELLSDAGIKYFFVDTHGIMHASQRPYHGVYAPLDCGNGVAVFARDPDSSRQVWSHMKISRRFRLPRILPRHRFRS
jgi:1,4-alpha-glucan branching enzyme